MFDWLFKNEDDQIIDLLEVLKIDLTKIQLSAFAWERAITMIANAIAKSEIVCFDGKERLKNDNYFTLNIRPNDNETGTDFWYRVTRDLLTKGECLVIPINGKLYRADTWTMTNTVMYPKTYSSITITDGTDTYSLGRTFTADDVLHLKYGTDQLRLYAKNVIDSYNSALQALKDMEVIGNTPLLKYKTDTNMAFRRKLADGTEERLTIDKVLAELKETITKGGIQIIHEQNGTSLEFMDNKASVNSSELKNMADEINRECAIAFGIPVMLFNFDVTDKEQANSDFMTHAVAPVAEVFNDTLSAKIVGREDYLKGERVFVWINNFQHRDVLDVANGGDKLRAIGFTLDEIRELLGYEALNTDFSKSRALTKNYSTEEGDGSMEPAEGGEEGSDAEDRADEPETETGAENQSGNKSKHRERRKRRYG